MRWTRQREGRPRTKSRCGKKRGSNRSLCLQKIEIGGKKKKASRRSTAGQMPQGTRQSIAGYQKGGKIGDSQNYVKHFESKGRRNYYVHKQEKASKREGSLRFTLASVATLAVQIL